MDLTKPSTSGLTRITKRPTTFTCFNRLPTELQIQIWKLAASIKSRSNVNVFSQTSWPEIYLRDNPWRLVSESTPPSILSVCRESRFQGLKHLTLYDDKDSPFHLRQGQKIYINWSYDRLVIPRSPNCAFYDVCYQPTWFFAVNELRSLAVGLPDDEEYKNGPEMGTLDGFVRHFCPDIFFLEELVLFFDKRDLETPLGPIQFEEIEAEDWDPFQRDIADSVQRRVEEVWKNQRGVKAPLKSFCLRWCSVRLAPSRYHCEDA